MQLFQDKSQLRDLQLEILTTGQSAPASPDSYHGCALACLTEAIGLQVAYSINVILSYQEKWVMESYTFPLVMQICLQ